MQQRHMGLRKPQGCMAKIEKVHPLTLEQKYNTMLAHLKEDRANKKNEDWWNFMLDAKIIALEATMKEKGYEIKH